MDEIRQEYAHQRFVLVMVAASMVLGGVLGFVVGYFYCGHVVGIICGWPWFWILVGASALFALTAEGLVRFDDFLNRRKH